MIIIDLSEIAKEVKAVENAVKANRIQGILDGINITMLSQQITEPTVDLINQIEYYKDELKKLK